MPFGSALAGRLLFRSKRVEVPPGWKPLNPARWTLNNLLESREHPGCGGLDLERRLSPTDVRGLSLLLLPPSRYCPLHPTSFWPLQDHRQKLPTPDCELQDQVPEP
ncbi:hypothetical protein H1C71_011830 [Ictidomys tridecemlineatus]|nr:hypothetical protein H1C71_011830 [Ictidomys tridecemlineatus]